MSCPLHGNVWCTCRSSFPTNKELEEADRAGKQLAEDVSNIGKPCRVCGSKKGHTTFDEFSKCRLKCKKEGS